MIKFASTKLASTIKTDHTFITVVVEVHWIPIILQKLFITKILWLDDIIIDSLLMRFSRLKYFLMITNWELFITYSQFFKFLFENFMKAYKVFFFKSSLKFHSKPSSNTFPFSLWYFLMTFTSLFLLKSLHALSVVCVYLGVGSSTG